MANDFGTRLHAAVRKRGNAVCVGLDPRWAQLPKPVQESVREKPGDVRTQQAAAYAAFCCAIIDTVADLVPVVKPQVAFFEALGPAGMAALQTVIIAARQAGLIVIADAKRGDIGTTAEAYAAAFLAGEDPDSSPWPADALTVNPYLGRDTLQPFVDVAAARGAGLYVLVRTSNPQAGTLQDLTADGLPVYCHAAAMVEQLSAAMALDPTGYGSIGAVVGATYPRELVDLRQRMPHVPLLIPGYGAQGGTAGDVAAAFDANGLGAVVNSSRGIIFAFEKRPMGESSNTDWTVAVREATLKMIADLAAAVPAVKPQQCRM